MTTREELAVHRRWRRYRVGKPVSNKSMESFYREVIQADPGLRHRNAYEILDSITNLVPRSIATAL